MANHKSALKKYYRDEKRRMVNKVIRSKMKNRVKLFIKKLDAGELEEAKTLFPQVMSRIDKTTGKGTIHRKTGLDINPELLSAPGKQDCKFNHPFDSRDGFVKPVINNRKGIER